MIAFRVAWRNLWRNRGRTAITMAAVVFSTVVLVVTFGLMYGMVAGMLANVTGMITGEAQVHHPRYREEQSFYDAIDDPEKILKAARRAGIQATPRSYGAALIALGSKSAPARVWGVDPRAERLAFNLPHHVQKGAFLGDRAAKGIVLGKRLARSIGARVGGEVALVCMASKGYPTGELFTVIGVYKTAGEEFDRGAAMIHRDDFEELYEAEGRVHEIALTSRGAMDPGDIAKALGPAMGTAKLRTWRGLFPAIATMMAMFDVSMFLFGMIFFAAAGLGVMNTMLMATFERSREIGVQKALGATAGSIVRGITLEGLTLGVFASALGVLLAMPIIWRLREHGIDLSGMLASDISIYGVAIDPVWRAELNARVVWIPLVSMSVVSVLAALYPAVSAARLDPVKAIHRP